MKEKRIQTAILAGLLLWVGFTVGCVSTRSGPAPEPPVIVIRNSCSQDLRSVILSETRVGTHDLVRYGEIAPVPMGASQVFVRPSKTQPLPSAILIAWQTAEGRQFGQSLILERVLEKAKGSANESLVFEILDEKRAQVFLEYAPRR